VQTLVRLLDGVDDPVAVSVTETRVVVDAPDLTVRSKLIDGRFPDYERVIPAGNDNAVVIDRDALARAVGRVTAIGLGKFSGVVLCVAAGCLTVRGASDNGSEAVDAVDAEYNGEEQNIGVNGKYLADILDNIRTDGVRILFKDAVTPLILQPTDDTSTDLFVLMIWSRQNTRQSALFCSGSRCTKYRRLFRCIWCATRSALSISSSPIAMIAAGIARPIATRRSTMGCSSTPRHSSPWAASGCVSMRTQRPKRSWSACARRS